MSKSKWSISRWLRCLIVCLIAVCHGYAALPYVADYELSEGFQLGSLQGQDSWQILEGSAFVTDDLAFSGLNSISLTNGLDVAVAVREFSQVLGYDVVYLDLYMRVSVDEVVSQSAALETEMSRVGLVDTAGVGAIWVFDGDGGGLGQWLDTGSSFSIDGNAQATGWTRFTIRQDYNLAKWDLYINGQMIMHDIGPIDLSKTYFERVLFQSAVAGVGHFDSLYIGSDNPLFVDSDNDGMDDAWELLNGLNTGINDRTSDSDGDGVDNVSEFIMSTEANNPDTDGDGIRDGAEAYLGLNPLVVDADLIPGAISGRKVHLKADAGITTDVNNKVSSWGSQSSLAISAAQATAANRPLYVTNEVNGHPVVRFNGSNNYLNLPHFTAGMAAGELFVVVKASSATSSNRCLFSYFGSGGSTKYPASSGQISDGFGVTTTSTFGVSPVDIAAFQIYNVSAVAGNWRSILSGVPLYSSTANVNFANAGFTPTIGADRSGAYNSHAAWFSGDVAEIIIYDRALSTLERDAIGGYLKTKYGISIALPSTPVDLTARALSSESISLTWGGDLGARYLLERSVVGGAWGTVAEIDGSTSYVDAGLSSGVAYYYRLRALNHAGVSSIAGPVGAVTFTEDIVDQFPESGIRLWLKPEDLFRSAGGLHAWMDRGGTREDATQAVKANRPEVVVNSMNGQPVARLNGSNSYLNLPHFMSGALASEMFVVMKRTTASNGACLMSYIGASGGTFYPNATNTIRDGYGSTANHTFLAGGHDVTVPAIYSVMASPGIWGAAINGGVLYSASTNSVNFTNSSFAPLIGAARGGAYYALSNWFGGDIGEVIIFDRTLSLVERYAVGTYLNRKFSLGIQAPVLPANFSAAVISPSAVSLSWTGEGAHLYILQRSSGGGVWEDVAALLGKTAYTDDELQFSTEYKYRIKAVSYGGQSNYTAEVPVTTLDTGEMSELPLSGMRLWLRPEELQASIGGLALWSDQSGLGINATQATAANKPQVVSGSINGMPAVRFNGVNSALNLPHFMAGATAAELFVVVKGASGTNICLFSYMGASPRTFYPASGGQISDGFGSTVAKDFSPSGLSLSDAHFYNVQAKASDWRSTVDGILAYSTLTNSVNFANSSHTPLIGAARGGAYYALSNWFSGDIAEIIIYDRVLSDIEREAVGFYLNQRYRLSPHSFNLLHRHAYDSDNDGISNSQELILGTDPYNADSDTDGMPDGWEAVYGLDPTVDDAAGDVDGDGIHNLGEYLAGTSPVEPSEDDEASAVKLRVYQPR